MEQILACGRIKTSVFVDDFDRNIAVQQFVISAVDNPHSSFTDLRNDTVMAEFLTDQGRSLPDPC